MFCTHCSASIPDDSAFCPECGRPLLIRTPMFDSMTQGPPQGPPQGPAAGIGLDTRSLTANTSGQGKSAVVPSEIKGWNWGAFLFSAIWGLANGTYIALLVLIPYVGWVVVPFIVGAKGNTWAWQNKRWDSVEHFKRVQSLWAKWSIGLSLAIIGVVLVILIAAASNSGSGS